MMSRDQLAALLKTVNVEALSNESGVSAKTIYRLRNKSNDTTRATLEKLVAAAARLKGRKGSKASAQGAGA